MIKVARSWGVAPNDHGRALKIILQCERGSVCSEEWHKSVNPDRLKRALDSGKNVQIVK